MKRTKNKNQTGHKTKTEMEMKTNQHKTNQTKAETKRNGKHSKRQLWKQTKMETPETVTSGRKM